SKLMIYDMGLEIINGLARESPRVKAQGGGVELTGISAEKGDALVGEERSWAIGWLFSVIVFKRNRRGAAMFVGLSRYYVLWVCRYVVIARGESHGPLISPALRDLRYLFGSWCKSFRTQNELRRQRPCARVRVARVN